MMEINSERFEKNKAVLKRSWLEYYQQNGSYLKKIVENWFTRVGTPDGGYRVKGEWILGILAGKHPKFSEMLYTLYLSNDNVEKMIEILGLHFDPEKELEKLKTETENISIDLENPNPIIDRNLTDVKIDHNIKGVIIENKKLLPEIEEDEYLEKIRQENNT